MRCPARCQFLRSTVANRLLFRKKKTLLLSALVLLGSSFISIALALWLTWNVYEVVVLYWIQALVIGVFQRQKVRDMVDWYLRSGRSPYVRGRRLLLRRDTHKGFGLIYGLFWLLEGVMLLVMYTSERGLSLNSLTLFGAATLLVISHFFSYRAHRHADQQNAPTVERVLLLPLFRMLLPLHVFTVAVGFDADYGAGGILSWMLIKTAMDLGIHIYEHKQGHLEPTS